jgi:hypothetical protein
MRPSMMSARGMGRWLQAAAIILCGLMVATLARERFAESVGVDYEVLLLLPCLWLITGTRGRIPRAMGILGLLASSGTAAKLILIPLQHGDLVAIVHAVSSIPVWIGVLVAAAKRDSETGRTVGPSIHNVR